MDYDKLIDEVLDGKVPENLPRGKIVWWTHTKFEYNIEENNTRVLTSYNTFDEGKKKTKQEKQREKKKAREKRHEGKKGTKSI